MYYSRVVYSFTLPLVCVCVRVLYITARALERVKMSLKIIQTDEIVRLVNVYFETVWDTPIPFQIESFFVFSFFCFFLFPFESCGIERPQSSGTQRRDERERERETKKKLPFFHSFWRRQTRTERRVIIRGPRRPHERSPLVQTTKKLLFVTVYCLCIPS